MNPLVNSASCVKHHVLCGSASHLTRLAILLGLAGPEEVPVVQLVVELLHQR